GYVGSGRQAGVIIDRRARPSRLLRRRCEAAEEAGDPEAHAAFVCGRDGRQSDHDAEKCRPEGSHKDASRGGRLFHVRPLRLYRYLRFHHCSHVCDTASVNDETLDFRKKLKFGLPAGTRWLLGQCCGFATALAHELVTFGEALSYSRKGHSLTAVA